MSPAAAAAGAACGADGFGWLPGRWEGLAVEEEMEEVEVEEEVLSFDRSARGIMRLRN
jgi:hypothetical protein